MSKFVCRLGHHWNARQRSPKKCPTCNSPTLWNLDPDKTESLFFYITVREKNHPTYVGGRIHGWQLVEIIDKLREEYPEGRIELQEDKIIDEKPFYSSYGMIGVAIPKTMRGLIFGKSVDITREEELFPKVGTDPVMSSSILQTGEGIWEWRYKGTSKLGVFNSSSNLTIETLIRNSNLRIRTVELNEYDIFQVKYWHLDWKRVENELSRLNEDIKALYHDKLERPMILQFNLNIYKCDECGITVFSIPALQNLPEDFSMGVYDELASNIGSSPYHCKKPMTVLGTRPLPAIRQKDVEIFKEGYQEMTPRLGPKSAGKVVRSPINEFKGLINSRTQKTDEEVNKALEDMKTDAAKKSDEFNEALKSRRQKNEEKDEEDGSQESLSSLKSELKGVVTSRVELEKPHYIKIPFKRLIVIKCVDSEECGESMFWDANDPFPEHCDKTMEWAPRHDREYMIKCIECDEEMEWTPNKPLPEHCGKTMEWAIRVVKSCYKCELRHDCDGMTITEHCSISQKMFIISNQVSTKTKCAECGEEMEWLINLPNPKHCGIRMEWVNLHSVMEKFDKYPQLNSMIKCKECGEEIMWHRLLSLPEHCGYQTEWLDGVEMDWNTVRAEMTKQDEMEDDINE